MSRFNFNEIKITDKADITKVQQNFDKIEEKSIIKDDLVIITGQIPLVNGKGNLSIPYPTGLNKDNCIPMIIGIQPVNEGAYFYISNPNRIIGVTLNDSNILIQCNPLRNFDEAIYANVKLVLLKL